MYNNEINFIKNFYIFYYQISKKEDLVYIIYDMTRTFDNKMETFT